MADVLALRTGLTLEAADLAEGSVALNAGGSTKLPAFVLRWVKAADSADTRVDLPCYLDSSRNHVLLTARLPTSETAADLARRGVALTAA